MIEIVAMALAMHSTPPAVATLDSPPQAVQAGEARARRLRSEEVLLSQGVPFDKSAPLIAESATPPSPERIVARLRAVELVYRRAESEDFEAGRAALAALGDQVSLTPREAAYMANPTPSRTDEARFIAYERTAVPLVWALGWLSWHGALGKPEITTAGFPIAMGDEPIDPEDITTRELKDLLDTADLGHLYALAARAQSDAGAETPEWFDPVTALERNRALSWLINPVDAVWDGEEDIR